MTPRAEKLFKLMHTSGVRRDIYKSGDNPDYWYITGNDIPDRGPFFYSDISELLTNGLLIHTFKDAPTDSYSLADRHIPL